VQLMPDLKADVTMQPGNVAASICLRLKGVPTLLSTLKALDPKKRKS
jgi:hypothetical protein